MGRARRTSCRASDGGAVLGVWEDEGAGGKAPHFYFILPYALMPGPLAAPPMGVGVLVISHFFVAAPSGLATSAAHQWRIFADQRDARATCAFFLAIGGSGLRQRVLTSV